MTLFLSRWTTDMVDHMPHLEGERYEIIQGELYVTAAPHLRHQATCMRICFELELWAQGHGVAIPAPGLIYAADEAVIPDVVWISKARLAQILGQDGKLHASPELVVEVLSPGKANEERDREKKLDLYSRRGVQESWIADWQTSSLEVYRPLEEKLALVATLQAGDTLTSPLLPGFSCVIERFFNL